MRKYKKKELCNCIETLEKAHKIVENAEISVKNEILSQCQEMAIKIGTEIDCAEGEGTIAVSYLEEYCEEVYQEAVSSQKGDWMIHQKNARKLLKQFAYSVREDIPDSPAEIVFLPYKASMWDAFDSVYRAAKEESGCNIMVMPIPYYNINPQGEVISIEYEGNQFPDDILIADFSMVDLEKLHPDVIFIHNPYDEWNRVTQVPEKYFSSTLVNQTEHLVYIPYFVTKGDKIKEDYCCLPAVRNAWRTFVQSDAVRDCYIKNGIAAKKVVALGSPKFDMVVQMQENKPTIPINWWEALHDRKVFLLNTHLNPIINNAQRAIERLHEIFLLFREREDVALLWRPHPLSIQTVKSMNPEMLDRYLRLIEEFKSLSNGVYDDTADVHRAIALSDAYIGNWSSLVTLYGITGKPIFIMDVREETKVRIPEEDTCLSFASGALQEDIIWTADEKHNGLYKVNLVQERAEFITNFEKENLFMQAMYHRVIPYKDKIYLIPWKAERIAVYDIATKELHYLTLDSECEGPYKFSEAMQYKNYLYLFPAYASAIIRMNLQNEDINYYSLEKLTGWRTAVADYSMFLNGERCDNTAWVASRREACMLEFDMEKCHGVLHYMKHDKAELVDVACNKDEVFILNVNGDVLLWDTEREEEKVVWKYNGDIKGAPFYRIVEMNHYLYLLPGKENKVIKIDLLREYRTKEIFFPEGWCEKNIGITKFYDYLKQNHRILIYPGNMERLAELDGDKDFIKIKPIMLSDLEPYNKRVSYQMEHQAKDNKKPLYLYGEKICSIEYFANCVLDGREMYSTQRKEAFRKMQLHSDGSCGQMIWNYIHHEIE